MHTYQNVVYFGLGKIRSLTMSKDYSSHADYMKWVSRDARQRQDKIQSAICNAFAGYIEKRTTEVVVFASISAVKLARIINKYPIILKPLLISCNIAARSIERDLQIKNLNTYKPKLTEQQTAAIAGYIKPFLPPYLEVPTLTNLDMVAYIDKEIRMRKGRWEQEITKVLNRYGSVKFNKRKFVAENEEFEIDAASPKSGPVKIAVDIKRIEARRDIHKRCDEIVNKAAKLKGSFPDSKFAAVIYYPFIDEQINIQNRMKSENIEYVVFASDLKESITNAIRLLLKQMGVAR